MLAAIKSASRETGSDFAYLLATAQRESNLDNTAKSKGSSATGLFQFIDQTWLSLIKRYGGEHGLGHYADAISRTESGRLVVGTPETKSAILALREDPEISALMAGEAAAATKQSLECALGRAVCAGELYAAHFLGEGGAKRLIALNEQHSGARADLAFPEAAKANRNVFYHADGRAKTVGEVHAWAMGEHPASPAPAQQPQLAVASEAPRASNGTLSIDCVCACHSRRSRRSIRNSDPRLALRIHQRHDSKRRTSAAAFAAEFERKSARHLRGRIRCAVTRAPPGLISLPTALTTEPLLRRASVRLFCRMSSLHERDSWTADARRPASDPLASAARDGEMQLRTSHR